MQRRESWSAAEMMWMVEESLGRGPRSAWSQAPWREPGPTPHSAPAGRRRRLHRGGECSDELTVLRSLPPRFTHYNEVQTRRALGCKAARKLIRAAMCI